MMNKMKAICFRAFAILWRIYRGVNKKVVHIFLPYLVKTNSDGLELVKYGTDYGGWTVPANHLRSQSICYCVGVGLDASFDFKLIEQHCCQVFSFDPTPMATEYMKSCEYDQTKLIFEPVGVWNTDTSLRFYESTHPLHSNSVYDLHGTGKYVEVPCKRIATLMEKYQHQHIDLLKLDIEGAWQKVVKNIVEEQVSLSMLCVEFDSPVSLLKVLSIISILKEVDLVLAHFEKDNYLFVKKELLAK